MISKNAKIYSDPIPDELIFDILMRLPVKSIARCRCVSKSWESMLRTPDFTELFLTRSCAQPQLLFACTKQYKEVIFFSSSQPQNLDENSSLVSVNYRMKLVFDRGYDMFSPVGGLVCFKDRQTNSNGKFTPAVGMVICNPSTEQSFTLPKMKMGKRAVQPISFFGYDAVGKQCKVLSMSVSRGVSQEHQVFRLGVGELSWRKIKCGLTHRPVSKVICINGVVYYAANSPNPMIVCFDVRTEKFSFVKVTEDFISELPCITLVNYKGKLTSLRRLFPYYICASSISFEMCVLEDPEKHQWSKHVYEWPPMWTDLVGESILGFVGVTTCTNEVVLAPNTVSKPFYVFYYNLERKTIRRIEIQGIRAPKGSRIQTFVNHVENLKFM